MPESSLSPWIDALGPPPLCAKEAVGNHKDSPMGLTRVSLLALDDGLPIHVSSGPKGQWGKGIRWLGWLLIVRMLGNTLNPYKYRSSVSCHFPLFSFYNSRYVGKSEQNASTMSLMSFLAAPNSCAKFLAGGIYSLYQLVQILSLNSYHIHLDQSWCFRKQAIRKTWHSSLVLAY